MELNNKLVKLREFIRCNLASFFPELATVTVASPVFADLKLVDGCSSRCRSCTIWRGQRLSELSTREWKEVICDLKQSGVLDVFFTGGDVFLRDDIFDLMEFCIAKGLGAHCVTNGYALNRRLANKLMRLKPASVYLSLDDMGVQFDAARGVADAGLRVGEAIAHLKTYHNGTTRVGLAATIMRDTIPSMKDVTRFAIQEHLFIMYNLIHFTHYYTRTPFSEKQYEIDERDREQLIGFVGWLKQVRRRYPHLLPRMPHIDFITSYFKDYRQRDIPCYKPLLDICIDPNGDIRPCCSDEPSGHALRDGIRNVLKSERYRQVVKKALEKSCDGCSCHYNLSLDMNLQIRLKAFLLRLRPVTSSESINRRTEGC